MLEEQEMNSGLYPDSDEEEDGDYDSDPPAALPKLTKQHEYKFKDLPSQLFRHLMLYRKRNEHFNFVCICILAMTISLEEIFTKSTKQLFDQIASPLAALMEYRGPIVLASTMMLDLEVGDRGLRVPCFFCKDKRPTDQIIEHFKSVHMNEIKQMAVEKRDKLGKLLALKFYQYLVTRAWFNHMNYLSWWRRKGVLMPQEFINYPRFPPSYALVSPDNTTFCSICYMVVEKACWNIHCATCIFIGSMEAKPSLKDNRLKLWQMYNCSIFKNCKRLNSHLK
jgi:hypothetical protein